LKSAIFLDFVSGSGHTAYCRFIDLYLDTKFHSNWKNFLWTDGRTDGRRSSRPNESSATYTYLQFIKLINWLISTALPDTRQWCHGKMSKVLQHSGHICTVTSNIICWSKCLWE